ncbi:MAG: cobalamin B12-binding domain-containing protein [Pseudomonadota bacterium]
MIESLRDFRDKYKTAKKQTKFSRLPVLAAHDRYDSLYAAAVSSDIEKAKAICLKLNADNKLHAGIVETVQRLECDWSSDHLSIHEIANAFWTLRRVLENHKTHKAMDRHAALGRGLIVVRNGEQHSFGAQLLADRLERSYWEVDLILDASNQAVLGRVEQSPYSVLGFSVGCDQNLLGLADLISSVRLRSCSKEVKVLVGGPVFQGPLKQYDFLGADAVCDNSETAMQLFGRLGKYHA